MVGVSKKVMEVFMALISCPECQKEISDKAANCPNCGCPIVAETVNTQKKDERGTTNPKRSKKKNIFILFGALLFVAVALVSIYMYTSYQKKQEELATQAEQQLVQAAEARTQEAFDTAKTAYAALNKAANSVISVMDTVYGAWHFGIFDADDSNYTNVVSNLAKTGNLSESDINSGVRALAKDYDKIFSVLLAMTGDDAFSYCVIVVNKAYEENSTFYSIKTNIESANTALKTMTADFDDYKHYPALKEFYATVSAYAAFAQNPTGSFQQLKDTINDYENSIRALRSDLSYVFD